MPRSQQFIEQSAPIKVRLPSNEGPCRGDSKLSERGRCEYQTSTNGLYPPAPGSQWLYRFAAAEFFWWPGPNF
jgi:hypothetical protein